MPISLEDAKTELHRQQESVSREINHLMKRVEDLRGTHSRLEDCLGLLTKIERMEEDFEGKDPLK